MSSRRRDMSGIEPESAISFAASLALPQADCALYRQLLPSGAASGEVAPRKRRQSRNVASGSRANDSADNDDRDGPPRRRSRDRLDDLANRRRFAMYQAAWFVDAASGGKGRRSEKRLGGLHRHASARHAIPRHSPKQRHSEIS